MTNKTYAIRIKHSSFPVFTEFRRTKSQNNYFLTDSREPSGVLYPGYTILYPGVVSMWSCWGLMHTLTFLFKNLFNRNWQSNNRQNSSKMTLSIITIISNLLQQSWKNPTFASKKWRHNTNIRTNLYIHLFSRRLYFLPRTKNTKKKLQHKNSSLFVARCCFWLKVQFPWTTLTEYKSINLRVK